MNVLVVRRGALGDTLCVIPLLDTLRREPSVHAVDFAGDSEIAQLFVAHGVVRRGLSCEDLPLWRTRAGESLDSLAGWDLVVGEAAYPDDDPRGLPFDVRVDAGRAVPASVQVLTRFRVSWQARFGTAPVASHDGRVALDVPRTEHDTPLLWFHLGAGSNRKLWPGLRTQLEPLLTPLLDAGWECTLSAGPADATILEELRGSAPHVLSRVRLFVDRPLDDLTRALAASTVYVGHDTGPSHLAASCGVPTVALFGPESSAGAWLPFGRAPVRHVEWHDSTPESVVDRILSAVRELSPPRR